MFSLTEITEAARAEAYEDLKLVRKTGAVAERVSDMLSPLMTIAQSAGRKFLIHHDGDTVGVWIDIGANPIAFQLAISKTGITVHHHGGSTTTLEDCDDPTELAEAFLDANRYFVERAVRKLVKLDVIKNPGPRPVR